MATVFTAEERVRIIDLVLDGMADGKTVADVVAAYAKEQRKGGEYDVLTAGQVRRWITEDEKVFGEYQRMKRMLGQAFAEEALKVARVSTSNTTAMDRVLIETLKWSAAKANPVEYGEKQTVEHQGSQTLQVRVVEEEGVPGRKGDAIAGAVVDQIVAPVYAILPPAKSREAL